MTDRFKYELQYTLKGISKTSIVRPSLSDIILNKDIEQYKDAVTCATKVTFYKDLSNKINDFDLLKSIESDSIFQQITMNIYESVNGNYSYLFSVYFSIVDGNMDNDYCKFETSIFFDDKYSCLFASYEKEYNLKDIAEPFPQYLIENAINLELFTCKAKYRVSINHSITATSDGDEITGHFGSDCEKLFDTPKWMENVNVGNDPNGLADYIVGLPLLIGVYQTENRGNPHKQSDGSLTFPVYPMSDSQGPYYFSAMEQHPSYLWNTIFASNDFKTSQFPYYSPSALPIQATTRIGKWRIYNNKITTIKQITDYGTIGVAEVDVETTWCCETAVTINGSQNEPIYPSGSGWYIFKDIRILGRWATVYGREPYYDNQYYEYSHIKNDCHEHIYKLKNPNTQQLVDVESVSSGYELTQTIQTLLDKADCDLTFKSQFLESEINPVDNITRNPVFVLNSTTDLKWYYSVGDTAVKIMCSLKKILDDLEVMFNGRWFIEGNTLRFEHIKFFENNNSYTVNNNVNAKDLTKQIEKQTGKNELLNTNKYKFNIEQLFNTESWNFTEYFNYDWSKLNIDYDIRLNKGLKTNNLSISINTDISGLILNSGSFNNENLTMVALELIDGVFYVIHENGYRTNKLLANGYLSLSNLFNRFYRNNRVLLQGHLDGYIYTEQFNSEKQKKNQQITVRDCNGIIFYQYSKVITNIGVGRITQIEHNVMKGLTKLTVEI